MSQDTCSEVAEDISMKKKDINTLKTIQNGTLGHESLNDSTWQPINSVTSESEDESRNVFKLNFDGNISTAENSKVNEHVLQQDNHAIDTDQNGTEIHESTNHSIRQSTTPGEEDKPYNNEENIQTVKYSNMILPKYRLQIDKDSSQSGDILLAKLNSDSEKSMNGEIGGLGTSEKNNESISTHDETGNQNAISRNEKIVSQNTTMKVFRNVENVQTKESTDKFFECSSKSKNSVEVVEDKKHDNHHLCHVTSVGKANEKVNNQLSNVTSLVDKNSTTRHLSHCYNIACGNRHGATGQLSHVNITASGKVNYAIFPNICPQPSHTLHKDITDDQLQRYLEDAFNESESIAKETLSSFNDGQNQEINFDNFVEISLEEMRSSNDSSIIRNQAQDTSSIQSKSHGKLCCLNKCFKRFLCSSSTKS